MSDTQWHAGPELLERYAAGTLDQVGQAAVETHVTGCAHCRLDAAAVVAERAPSSLDQVWDRVQVGIARPPEPRIFRLLHRVGVRETDLVILRSSANLLVALAVAILATVGFAVVAGFLKTGQQEFYYLLVAPLLPALLVAGAYDTTDPLRDIADATPFSSLRIALLRTLVAVLGALPLVSAMVLVPNIQASLVTWLLPSLALTLVVLVLLTWVEAPAALVAVSTGWLAALVTLQAGGDLSMATNPTGQAAFGVVLVCSAAVLLSRYGLFLRAEED